MRDRRGSAGGALAALALLVAGGAAMAAQTKQAPYTLQVQSRVVLTDVSVTDKHGQPVQGLTQSDFTILDNGRPQKIASFEEHRQPAEEMPVSAAVNAPGVFSNSYLTHPPAVVNVILIDATTIRIVDQMYLYEQMQHFVAKLPAGESTAVFDRRGDSALELQTFTSDHDLLMKAVRKAIPYPRRPGAWMASDYDTLIQMATYLAQVPGRKNLLWFTGGSNLYLSLDPTDAATAASMQPIYDMLEAERIALYPIDARGLTVGFSMAMGAQHMQMDQEAGATGGTCLLQHEWTGAGSTARSGHGRELLHADVFARRFARGRALAQGAGPAAGGRLPAELPAGIFRRWRRRAEDTERGAGADTADAHRAARGWKQGPGSPGPEHPDCVRSPGAAGDRSINCQWRETSEARRIGLCSAVRVAGKGNLPGDGGGE